MMIVKEAWNETNVEDIEKSIKFLWKKQEEILEQSLVTGGGKDCELYNSYEAIKIMLYEYKEWKEVATDKRLFVLPFQLGSTAYAVCEGEVKEVIVDSVDYMIQNGWKLFPTAEMAEIVMNMSKLNGK